MTTLWYKAGLPPGSLPFIASDPEGNSYTDLDHNPEGREACGFLEAPPQPTFDPTRERLDWADGGWVKVGIVPQVVSRLQARLALLHAGKLAEAEAAITAAADPALAIYWADTSAFHRDHPRMLAIAQSLGWTGDQLDALFTAAAEIS